MNANETRATEGTSTQPERISGDFPAGGRDAGNSGVVAHPAAIEKVATHYPNPYETRSLTPMEILQSAVDRGANIETLEKLMGLAERFEANEARKAYMKAMNEFKADPPEILKNHTVAYGQTTYDHATLDHVCKAVTAGLSKHNISHRWRIEQSEGFVKVTCILTHEMGHSEETTLCGGPDTSGSKNAIQAIGSTVTYLERYTLLAATGLAAKNGDNDGQGAPVWNKLQEFLDSMMTAPNMNVLDTTFKAGFKEATALKNTQAMLALIQAKDARKAILTKGDTGQA